MKELRRLFTLALFAVVFSVTCTTAFAQSGILSFTTWDEFYLYVACQVDDSDVTGTNAAPNSKPWNDDCVEVFIETDNKHAANRTPATFSMAVSPAGGSGFTVGDKGKFHQKPVVTYKYAQTVQGTINDGDDIDIGYQVEMAIPWQELRIIPKPGVMMSFNVVCRFKSRKKFVSLSSKVKTDADIQNPSKWSDIVLSGPAFGAATTTLQKIVCARYIAKRPTIDGKISVHEYNKNTSFAFAGPDTSSSPDAERKRPKRSLQRLIFARYLYDYQADPRKAAPTADVWSHDGRSQLTDFPAFAAGPWFSSDRVEWHKQELSEMANAGIDVVLPVYRGDKKSRTDYAVKGLDCMVQALRELKSERKEYPLVGLFFDTNCLSAAYDGEKPDLRTDGVKKTLYGMIKDFFQRIPPEFRAQAQITDDRAGYPIYIVYMGPDSEMAGCDDSFVSYVNDRFSKDFNARLTWVVPSDWKSMCPNADGYCSYPAGLGLKYEDTGMIRVAAVGPGYSNCATAETPAIRARQDGEAYKADWSIITSKRPNWILVDSWNDFKDGSEICGTRQFGYTYPDATAVCIGKMRAAKEYDAKYLAHDTPRVIAPGTFYQVRLLVRNDGTKPWTVTEGYGIGYKWFQNGRPVAEGLVKRPIQQDILPGKTGEVVVGLSAFDKKNRPLPEGDYEVYYEFYRMSDNRWFSVLGDEPFIAPVTIGKPPAMAATFVSADVPTMMESGGDYIVRTRVRNDGTETWTKGNIQIACRLWKESNYTNQNKVDAEHPVDCTPLILMLPKDVAPGEEATVEGIFSAKDSQGQPLPVWSSEDGSSYLLRWELMDGTDWLTDAGSYEQAVGIYASDPGPQFVAADVPQTISAGKTYDVKLMVKNRGAHEWKPGEESIGYHWYYLDGTEAEWDCPLTDLKKPVPPARNLGDIEFITAKVAAPPYDGRYILAWDLMEGQDWVSSGPISRGGDMLPMFVEVKDGALSFVDLSKAFDAIAAGPDTDRAAADFDGTGQSFPAESFLPDVPVTKTTSTVYPSGYYRGPAAAGPDSERKISFSYGPNAAGQKNVVICAGQSIDVRPGNYTAIHILGAAVEPDTRGKLGLTYGRETEQAEIAMSSWTEGPKHNEQIGYMSLHLHNKDGNVAGTKGYLYHYTVKLDPSRKLTGITLPANSKMRIAAVTLERGQ